MSNSFWLGWLPLGNIRQGRESFSVPAFSLTGMTWLGASYIAARFTLDSGTTSFVLRKLTAPSGVNYCPVVKSGSSRYKLWNNVGERLDLPLYNGEILAAGTTLELWTVQGSTTVSSTGLTLETSRLQDRSSETASDLSTAATITTSIWNAMPLVLPATFSSAKL